MGPAGAAGRDLAAVAGAVPDADAGGTAFEVVVAAEVWAAVRPDSGRVIEVLGDRDETGDPLAAPGASVRGLGVATDVEGADRYDGAG